MDRGLGKTGFFYSDNYKKFKRYFIIILAVFTGLLHIFQFTPWFTMESIKFYSWHLMLGFIFVFLYTPTSKKEPEKYAWIDWILIIGTALVIGYIIVHYDNIIDIIQNNKQDTTFIILGILSTLLVLEAARRVLGWALPVIALLAILYAYFGTNMPGLLGHRGYDINRIATTVLSDQGILGMPIGVSASNVFLFLMFGAFLGVSGADVIFQNISIALTRKSRGGPAKMAVVTSGFFGMISGSAVANVASTGSFTIPLMKRQGYSKRFAGAVTAVGSTGGQIMPPIMGAAAFVLADVAGVSYKTVALAAFIPAVMYYLTLFKMVDLESVKLGIKAIPEEEVPDLKGTLRQSIKLIVPLAVLLILLLGFNSTPMMAAIWSIVSIIVLGIFDKKDKMTLKKLIHGFVATTRSMPQVVAACACSGIVTGVFALTGLGLKLSHFIVNLGGNNIVLSLLLSMLICVVLGMGLPTTASYIICATAIAPALIQIGVPSLAAHLFLLYFASISAITPPVAVASYAAASIADENAMKVGWTAVKLGIAGFILPFTFAINPDYLHIGFDITTLITVISAVVVSMAAAVLIQGYIEKKATIIERLVCVVVIVLAIQSGLIQSILGWSLFGIMYLYRRYEAKKGE